MFERKQYKWAMIVVCCLVALSSQVLAESLPTGGALSESMSMQEIIETGGWIMYILGAMSVFGLAMIIYFLLVLRQGQLIPKKLLQNVQQLLSKGRVDETRALCRKKRSPVSSVILAALDYAQTTDDPEPTLLKEVIEGEGSRQATLIQNQIQYLLDIGVIAPMFGLLGTVWGMLKAFNTVALDLAKAKPMLLAAGVSQALITTVGGLAVAIPAMIFYAYFRGRTSKLLARLETVSAELLTLLIKKKP